MPTTIRVATTSLATFENVKPPYNLRNPSPKENIERGLSLLDLASKQGADIAVLPETFPAAGLPYEAETLMSVAESIPGPTFDALAERARRHHMYVVAGLPLSLGSRGVYNSAVLIDRDGSLVGTYAKMHPTEGEIASGIVAGHETAVYDVDFGRVGLAICFDLNWPSLWEDMANQKADLVCWISAYPGGFPLQAYAWQNQYRIASAVWSYEARIVDFTGRILAETTRWDRLAVADLDLDKRLFHTDQQYERILAIREKYGQRISLETFHEEHLFTVESRDPHLTVSHVIAEFRLIEFKDYIARCTQAQVGSRLK